MNVVLAQRYLLLLKYQAKSVGSKNSGQSITNMHMNSLIFLPFSFKLCLGIFKHQHFELWWKTKYWHQSIAVSFIHIDFYTYDYVVYAFYGLFISILYSHWSPFNSQQSIFSRIYSACRWHNVDGVALLIFRPCTTASMINI